MQLRLQIAVFTLLQTIMNTMHRMVYPFLAVFARSLGVDLTALSLAVTGRSLVGLFIPLLASTADRHGRRFGMLAGILVFTFGVGLVAFWPNLITLSVALILGLLGKHLFDPAMQAYLGDRVPYHQRGTTLAITEVSWSLAFILGIPAIGWIISRMGWSAPFPMLAGFGVLMLIVIAWMVPQKDEQHDPAVHVRGEFQSILSSIPAMAGISIAFWASSAHELVNLIFGVWLEDSFGLKIAALAGASAVIGFAELSGEGLVAFTTDRLGKPRALGMGLLLNSLSAIALPFLGTTQIGALIGLFLFYITFEYTVVSQLPMMSELMPKARATLLTLNITGHSLGRVLGAFLATLIYQTYGFLPAALGAVVFNSCGMLALLTLQKTQKAAVIERPTLP